MAKIFKTHLFKITLLAILIVNAFVISITRLKKNAAEAKSTTHVIYNNNDAPDKAIVQLIDDAQSYVYFAIYTITKENIVSALIAAKLRGVQVKGVLDFNQSITTEEKPYVNRLKKYQIPLEIPFKEQGLMHIKMLVTEKGYASGSYNWTNSGTNINDEVLEYGNDDELRKQYLKIINQLFKKYAKSLVIL